MEAEFQQGMQALGLSAARLQATLGDGRLAADAVLRGSRLDDAIVKSAANKATVGNRMGNIRGIRWNNPLS